MAEPKLKRWTTAEDELLLSLVQQHLRANGALKHAFKYVSEETGRTIGAVTARFANYTKIVYKAELKPFNLLSHRDLPRDFRNADEGEEAKKDIDWSKMHDYFFELEARYKALMQENTNLQGQLHDAATEIIKLKDELDFLKRDAYPHNSDGGKVSGVIKLLNHAEALGIFDKNLSVK